MRAWRESFRRVLQLDDTPRSIAWGAVIGLFIGMAPPLGPQSVAAFFVAWLFRVNRLAAVLMTFLTNPATVFIYVIHYLVGAWCLAVTMGWESSPWREVWESLRQSEGLWEWSKELAGAGLAVIVPMAVGGFLLAATAAPFVYFWIHRWVSERRAAAGSSMESTL